MEASQPNTTSGKRPVVLSILCVLSLFAMTVTLVALLVSPSVRSEIVAQVGHGYLLFTIFSFPFAIAALVGIWLMRRWGVYLYILWTVVGYIANLWLGYNPGVGAVFFSLLMIGIPLAYFKRFR